MRFFLDIFTRLHIECVLILSYLFSAFFISTFYNSLLQRMTNVVKWSQQNCIDPCSALMDFIQETLCYFGAIGRSSRNLRMRIRTLCSFVKVFCYHGQKVCAFAGDVCVWASWKNLGDKFKVVHKVLDMIHGWTIVVDRFLEHLEMYFD